MSEGRQSCGCGTVGVYRLGLHTLGALALLLVAGLSFAATSVAGPAARRTAQHGARVATTPGARVATTHAIRNNTKATDPFAGRGMWIWYVSQSSGGTVSSIVATARRYGISTVMVKSGDGTTPWSQFNPELVSALHAAHIHVCGWQYVYGDYPKIEAEVGADAVRDGADCLIIDAEGEYQGKYIQAQKYISELRKLIGPNFPVALAGLPYVDYHPAFPYSVFLGPGGAQYNLPQMYWVDIGTSVDGVYAATYTGNSVYQRQINPLGQVWENPPAGQIVRFRQLSRFYGAPGVSWWDWQQASRGGWRAVSEAAGNLRGYSSEAGVPILAHGAAGDLVVWAQEHLVSAGYSIAVDGDFGALTQTAVEDFQAAKGLTVDGIIGPQTWGALLAYSPAPVVWSNSGATIASARRRPLVLAVPKSARLPQVRDEIAGAGGAG